MFGCFTFSINPVPDFYVNFISHLIAYGKQNIIDRPFLFGNNNHHLDTDDDDDDDDDENVRAVISGFCQKILTNINPLLEMFKSVLPRKNKKKKVEKKRYENQTIGSSVQVDGKGF